jgi:dipeptidyl aminopeptidase/acylaminoacyl peptidase
MNGHTPRWSPDGRYLAFIARDGGAGPQLHLLEIHDQRTEQLTSPPGGITNFKWSPDGSMIAFLTTDQPTQEEAKRRILHDDVLHVDREYRYSRLWVLTLTGHQLQQVTRQDTSVTDFDWSPDGNRFVLVIAPTPRRDDYFFHSSLAVISRTTGEIIYTLSDRLTSRFGPAPKWSPDGRTIAFAAMTPSKLTAWLTLMPSGGGPLRYLLQNYPGNVWEWDWAPDSRHLIAEGIARTRTKLLQIDTATEAVTEVATLSAPGPDFTITRDGRTLAFLGETAHSPGDAWVVHLGGSPRRISNLNPQLSSFRLGEVTEVSWKNKHDGRTLYGVLIKPPGFRANRPCPTVMQIHGGPQQAWGSGWQGSWAAWGQFLASNGYAVFLPNPRGSTGQGWQFAELADFGQMDFQDVMDGLNLLTNQGIADPNALGIGGWSYGGFLSTWAVTHTDRFKAAVVHGAISDVFTWGLTFDAPSYLPLVLGGPQGRRDTYDKHSPLTFLQNARTPMLVSHGQDDLTVPLEQGRAIFQGLKMMGVETEMLIFPREGHAIVEPAHQIAFLTALLAWFRKYLPPIPP